MKLKEIMKELKVHIKDNHYEIVKMILAKHMNPLTKEQIDYLDNTMICEFRRLFRTP